MSEVEKKWYILRAVSGKEAKVKEYLDAELNNGRLSSSLVSQVLIPSEKVYTNRNGKKVVKERNSFPGYVFVEAALVGEIPHHLSNTPNVIGFLGGANPDPVAPADMNRILGRVDELQDSEEELVIPFIVGETVKVAYGPFSGFSGVIEEVNNEKKKLKVMVKIFGRGTPLELNFMQVEKE